MKDDRRYIFSSLSLSRARSLNIFFASSSFKIPSLFLFPFSGHQNNKVESVIITGPSVFYSLELSIGLLPLCSSVFSVFFRSGNGFTYNYKYGRGGGVVAA